MHIGIRVPSLRQALFGPSKAEIKKMPPHRWYRVKRFGCLKRWVHAEDRRLDDTIVDKVEIKKPR